MKNKYTFLLLIVVLLFGVGCHSVPDADESSSSATTSQSSDQTLSQTAVIQGETYGYTVTYNENAQIQTLSVIRQSNKQVLQTITPGTTEGFTKQPAYFIDVTFDGYSDLVIPLTRSAYAGTFEAHAFDPDNVRFVKIQGFEQLANPAFDTTQKQILCHFSGDNTESYSIYQYDASGAIVCLRDLFWYPSGQEGQLQLVEGQNGVLEKSVVWQGEFAQGLDPDNEQLAPYLAAGSLWDLNSTKWDSPFLKELK